MTRALVALTLIFAGTSVAQAQPAPTEPQLGIRDLGHARSYGMGGAYRSLGEAAEAIDGNPASMGVLRHYLVELAGGWDVQAKDGFGTVGILDSVSSPVAAGLSYHLVTLGRGEGRTTAHLNTVAIGFPLFESVYVGASIRHVLMTGDKLAGATISNAITLDLGLTLHLSTAFVASFSGHNLIDIGNPYMTRYFAGSVGYLGQAFTLAFDMRLDPGLNPGHKLAYNFGAEYMLGSSFPVRGGYEYDTLSRSHFLSGGIGMVFQGGGIDLAYRHELGGIEGRLLAATIRYQMQ